MLANIIYILAGICGGCTVLVIALPFIRENRKSKRQANIVNYRHQLEKQRIDSLETKKNTKSVTFNSEKARELLQKFKITNLIKTDEIRSKLSQAGWRSSNAVFVYSVTKVGGLLCFMICASLFLTLEQKFNPNVPVRFLIIGIASVLGFYFSDLILKNQIQNRQIEMRKTFPDAVDLLFICVQSGLTIEAAFAKVAEELGKTSESLSEEFGITSAELSFLGDNESAYLNFASRTGLNEAKTLATTLIQASQYGTHVSQSLKILSDESKSTSMATAEEKGAALPAKLTVPMIVFFLPALFLVILGPAILKFMK